MARPSDIVVVGAGIVGCALVYELARRGASVSVLDDRPVGGGATQASGGMLAPYSEAADGGPLLDLGVRSLALFDALVASVEHDSGLPVGYARSGTLHIARAEESLAEFRETCHALAERGVASRCLSASDARDCEPNLATDVRGGLLIPSQGLVSALDMTRAMAAAAMHHGARFLDPARARRVRASDGVITIDTTHGPITADAVVVATGAWSGQLEIDGASAPTPVRPIRGQLLHLGRSGPPLSRITWDERCYLVPWRDGTLLVGATSDDAGFDERVTVGGVRTLLDVACALIPDLSGASLLSTRVGLRPASPDPLPIMGWSEVMPGLMYATGHYRNGVLLAPITAQLVADAMLDGTSDPVLDVTRPSRFGRL